MIDRPNPYPDILYIEALASLPNEAIITFGRNMVTAMVMGCVRNPAYQQVVQTYARMHTSIQQADSTQFHGNYVCTCCLRTLCLHDGVPYGARD